MIKVFRFRLTGLIAVLLISGCAMDSKSRTAPIVERAVIPQSVKAKPPAVTAPIDPEPAVRTAPLDSPDTRIIAEPLATPPSSTLNNLGPSDPPVIKPGSAPIVALLDSASEQQRGGRLDGAAAALERALRIAPQNPVIWQRLADVRLKQGRYDQAIQLATKANSFAAEDRFLQARNWRIISQARENKGDKAGAQVAQEQARRLESDGL